MKKYRIYIVFVILFGALFVLYGIKCVEYTKTQNRNELLQKEHEELRSTYAELERDMAKSEELNLKLENELIAWKDSANIEGWQVFYGGWHTDRYYEANKSEIQKSEDAKMICIQHNHISMTGHSLTAEPLYRVSVRIKGDVVESIKEIGVENSELTSMLQEDHYAEIAFDNTYRWEREPLDAEKDMIQNVKYYLFDNDTMLCVAQNSSRVYVLGRMTH